jgi:positive regulator of sigma E activity
MSVLASPLLVYLWHYLVARLLFDQLLGGLAHSRAAILVAVLCAGAGGYWVGRRRRRRLR